MTTVINVENICSSEYCGNRGTTTNIIAPWMLNWSEKSALMLNNNNKEKQSVCSLVCKL